MNHGSLFSGIGGFDLAAEWMGWNNKFHCDINEFSRKICGFYWPDAQSYEDIKTTDFTIWRNKIDVLSGGFPCQPFSHAGKRMGKEDDRHLWPEMVRAIREIRPRYVVGENVRGIVSWSNGLVFEEVFTDLENEGYESWAFVLPAVGINAPHKRDRVYFIAKDTSSDGCLQRQTQEKGAAFREQRDPSTRSADGLHLQEKCSANTNSGGLEGSKALGRDSKYVERESELGDSANSERIRLEYGNKARNIFGSFSKAQRKERKLANDLASDDNVRSQQGGPSETWDSFPIKPPLCSGDDGLPTELDGLTFPKWRKESIMGYGNAIVPQIAYRIFATIDEID